ncbi:DUF2231 domain-containing protein [Opitutus terrae]|uniref:DUF2231 domain-containing protein n=1 Tax=Opitutus terrae (strain DSM 11246 / JCM 15787 / PB90-1) TaxID=452637 RepID=B1ZMG2_OPITP|nr:DUF2231 domain-containing protein [Opitutus terrae]ACB73415.1 conserved hypothetical protein [Opitutus terrae PB90-1]
MKLLDILQGKWLGHPLHPAIVHVPIGTWLLACGLDVAYWAGWTGAGPARLAFYAVVAGLLTALIAVPPGIADWVKIKKEKPAWKLGLYHMSLNLLAALVWAVNCGLRLGTDDDLVTLPVLLTSVIGTVIILISGYLGSLMVFDHGISVAGQSKKKWRKIAAQSGSRLPEQT